MAAHIHINCDMGEAFGIYRHVNDENFMPFINACNIACGFHGGDPVVIDKTLKSALKYNLEIGAHPSYPDQQGFGRRSMKIPQQELYSLLRYQIAALKSMVESLGGNLSHIKAHGALYNDAIHDEQKAQAIIDAILSFDDKLKVYTLPFGKLHDLALKADMTVIPEAFMDRTYTDQGTLVNRSLDGSCITDPEVALAQVKSIVDNQEVSTLSNTIFPMQAQTFCIHSDTDTALDILRFIRNET